eukprot:GGOE01045900.1.p1 GENE.GGOE01045900.1~~GGOE01045900.1.p1  ORF type:complete len:918 (+),score=237.92 GGOE01045900.1:96-2849(+)
MRAITIKPAAEAAVPNAELQLRAAGEEVLKHAPVVRLKTNQEGRAVAIRYWIVRDSSQRTQDSARAILPVAWTKAYIGARDIIKAIQADDQTVTCNFSTAAFLFVPDNPEEALDECPEMHASDIFSLQTGITVFAIQVLPITLSCHAPIICRCSFQLALDHRTSSAFKFSEIHMGNGCLRYWDPELQGYILAADDHPIPPTNGQSLRVLVEQKVVGSASVPEPSPTKQLPRESFASIFSRLVDHQQLSAVAHVATEHPDWQAASRALQLGFLTAKSGHTDKALRGLLWNGVPHRYRRGFWLAMSGGLATIRANPRAYDTALAKVLAHRDKYTSDQIASTPQLSPDMARVPLFGAEFDPHTETLRTIAYSILNPEGQRQAKVVLCVLQETHPKLFYAPGLPVLLCLLLFFLSAEEAYSTLACLLHISWLGGLPWFFRASRAENELVLSWFDGLLADRQAELHAHLQTLRVNVSAILSRWLNHFFAEHLPLHAVLQAVDVFLMEGAPVLYRLALAIFALLEGDLLACQSCLEVEEVLQARVAQLAVPDLFLRAYRIRLTRKDIPFVDKDIDVDQRLAENVPMLCDPHRNDSGDVGQGKKHFLNPLRGRKDSGASSVNPFAPLPAIGTSNLGSPSSTFIFEPGLILLDGGGGSLRPSPHSPMPHRGVPSLPDVDDEVQVEAVEETKSDLLGDHHFNGRRRGQYIEWQPSGGEQPGTAGSRARNPLRSSRRTRSLSPTTAQQAANDSLTHFPDVAEVNALIHLTASGRAEGPTHWRLDLPASSPCLYGAAPQPGDSPSQRGQLTPQRATSGGGVEPHIGSPTVPVLQCGHLRPRRGSPAGASTSVDRGSGPKSLLKSSDAITVSRSPQYGRLALEVTEEMSGMAEMHSSPSSASAEPSTTSPPITLLQMRRHSARQNSGTP